MRKFCCYFIDEAGAIMAWKLIEHETHESAQHHALGQLTGHPPAMIVELWEGADLAFRYSRLETPQTQTELRRLCALAIAAADEEADIALKRAIAWGAANLASQAEEMERRGARAGSTGRATRGQLKLALSVSVRKRTY